MHVYCDFVILCVAVLVPADKAANNIVVVCRLHYINTLKQELDGTRAYLETNTYKIL